LLSARAVPVVMISGPTQSDAEAALAALDRGAVDYLAKPVTPEVLRSKLAVFIGLNDMNRMLSAELAERALSEQRLRASEENLRALAAHLESVREEERVRIAREIHDELGQALTGLKFDIGGLAKACASDPNVAERTAAIGMAIDRIITSVRRIASGLRPEVLDEIGLSAAVEWQGREFSRRTGIRCSVEIDPAFADPDSERSTAVFRILQELLTNVARHANATRVNVHLADGDMIRLRVEDNGRGIEKGKFQHSRSLGFMGLRERVLAFGGSIEVEGHQGDGTGTTVHVVIPNYVTQTVYHA